MMPNIKLTPKESLLSILEEIKSSSEIYGIPLLKKHHQQTPMHISQAKKEIKSKDSKLEDVHQIF